MTANERPAIAHTSGDGSPKPSPQLQSRFRFAGQYNEIDLLHAVHRAPQKYLGIQSALAAKTSPAWPIHQRTIESTDFAIEQSMSWWQGETSFQLVAADALFPIEHAAAEGLPPGCMLMRDPAALLQFDCADDRRQN